MRERRKSVHQSVHDERNSRPLPHVPGWIHHTVSFRNQVIMLLNN